MSARCTGTGSTRSFWRRRPATSAACDWWRSTRRASFIWSPAPGVTGERESLSSQVGPLIEAVRAVTDLPLAVGFGVSKPEHVAELGRQVEAVVVGSAIVRLIGEYGGDPSLERRLEAFVRELKGGFQGAHA